MTVIIPEGYAQVTLTFNAPNTFRGQTALVLGFGGPLGDDPTPLGEFAEAVALSYADNLAAQADSQMSLVSVRVVGPTTAAEYPANVPGGATLDDAPPNLALLVSHLTPRRGRRGRGRSFLYGFLSDTHVNVNGTVTTARLLQMQDVWTAFIADLTDPAQPGVNHVILQGDGGTTPPLSPPPQVTSSVVQPRCATQRRRLRR